MASTGGYFLCVFLTFIFLCDGAKINTPRVLLPWFENRNVNFTFEIIEGGCYTWSLSRDDIIDLEPIYDDTWGHCSRSARVSVSKSCVPPGSVIILAEELNSNEIIRGDVDIDKISFLKIISTTWKLYLEEAPEAFEVIAYDEQGNKFSTLEGIDFDWRIENTGSTLNDDPIVDLVPWTKTDYEAPKGISELEARGLHAHSVLLYGKAMGDSKVTVCLQSICTDFTLQVIASVVLNPATAYIAPGDALQYKVIRAKAGRLTVQNVADTMYNIKVDKSPIAILEDALSIVRGKELGTTAVHLMSGSTEVATGILNVVQPYSIRVNIRPPGLLIEGEEFTIYCLLLDGDGHALTAGPDVLIRLSVEGDANVELLRSTENGTLTNAVAQNSGKFTVVQGQTSGFAISPLQIVPPEMYVAWTDSKQILSAIPELVQVSSSGHARVSRPHHLHIALSATHPATGELFNFHRCDCNSFAVSLLDGPEPFNVTAVPWIEPLVRVSRGRAGEVARITVTAAPALVWPAAAALLTGATVPKGDTQLQLSSEMEGEVETAELDVSCAIWLRPGQDVSLKVTLLDSASRELLDEQGPQMSWEVQPNHIGIEFKSADRLFVETNPEYDPVPVPMSYYQVLSAGENAIGWSGMLKASIPDATATIQAKVVAPLSCQPTKVNIAWENESPPNISVVMGGSGRYAVETPKGVSARIENNALSAILPAPGSYELVVNIEEVMSVEVTSARAVSVGGCVPVSALARSSAGRPLAARRGEWRTSPNVAVRGEALCGLSEGAATVRAGIAGMWSPELEVSPSGVVHGVSLGTSRIKLIALDNTDVELATAEAVVETLLVGRPGRVWLEAGGLSTHALAALVPAPRATWSLRDAALATLHSTHAAHATAEGLSIRVVPLKPGLITIDVKIRNLGQMSESRSWDSTIEIFGIADIVPSVEGLKTGFVSDRLSVAVGATVKLNSVPRSTWVAYEDGAFDMRPNGELIALKPGRGVALARHRDERNNIDRETVVHVEVAIPQYCTAEPSNDEDSSIRVVLRDHIGRELVAPQANVSVLPPYSAHIRRSNSFAICLEGVGWRPSSAGVQVLAGAGVSLALLTRDTSGRHVLKLDRPPIQFTIHQMEFLPGDWPSSFVPIAIGSELTSNPLLCSEDQKYALLGLEVELPYICRTKPPHTAMSILDIPAGQLGCSIIQSSEITQPQEIDLCAEWGVFKTCTKVQLLPRIQILDTKISLLNPPATFTILGHPRTLKQIRITTSPGLRVEQTVKDSEMIVLVQSDSASCGHGSIKTPEKGANAVTNGASTYSVARYTAESYEELVKKSLCLEWSGSTNLWRH
ncbi:unnamed protein product [Leptidea sinapis]|uniref:Nuclear pore membrane glycoprotein 210 n=1 Tax=Leptidea sinapis TaxID=189913 RepID=A0A5E4Q794_9NEOP|nr:unnamed protein product [Leptidea sinapis]